MNILFFLTPKSEVAYINDDDTLRQALETMEFHKYAAVPIVNRQGRYIGTLMRGGSALRRFQEDRTINRFLRIPIWKI